MAGTDEKGKSLVGVGGGKVSRLDAFAVPVSKMGKDQQKSD